MNIDDWCLEQGISVRQMAKNLGIAHTYLVMIKNGQRRPGKFLAEAIERMTEGKVKAEDIRPEIRYNYCPLCGRRNPRKN